MPLTEAAIHKAKLKEKTYDLIDERGLSLVIKPKGDKWWCFKYRFEGKEKQVSLGVYPDMSLKDARKWRDEARRRVDAGIDPGKQKPVVENFVDDHLLQLAENGNREAIRAVAGLAVEHLQAMSKRCVAPPDPLTPFLIQAMEAMAEGEEPNKAFRWNIEGRTKPIENNDYRDWIFALYVADLMGPKDNRKMSKAAAVKLVCKSVNADEIETRSSTVYKAHSAWIDFIEADPEAIPDTILPISKKAKAAIALLERYPPIPLKK